MITSRIAVLVLSVAVSSTVSTAAFAERSPYDTSFGNGGLATIGFKPQFRSAWGMDAAIRSDHTLVTVGVAYNGRKERQFAVSVLSRAGTPVKGFGGDGRVTTRFGSRPEAEATAVLPTRHRKIVVAGTAGEALALARYTRRGALDATFGGDGRVTADVCLSECFVDEIVKGPRHTLVVTGAIGRRPALIRFLPDGDLDTSFANGGVWVGAEPLGVEPRGIGTILSTVPLDAGKVLTVGGDDQQAVLARYNADGTLDPSFGTDGRVTTKFIPDENSEYSRAQKAVVLDDGSILVGGTVSPGGDYTVSALARYDVSGALDPTFGTDGIVVTNFGDYYAGFNDLLVLRNGRVFAFGQATAGDNWRMAAAMYNADGDLVRRFGDDGILKTRFPHDQYGSYGSALAQRGDTVIGVGAAQARFAAVSYALSP